MMNKFIFMTVLAAMVAPSAFSAQERVIRVQNHLRFGYDDNIYQSDEKESSAEVMDILNISGKLNFSSRTDAVFSYQPEVRYRFDADPKTVTYHDAYGSLNHALSPRVFMTVSDRLRYQIKEAQSGSVSRTDQNYLENDLKGALDITASQKSFVKLGGGYRTRIWDDDDYGEWNSSTMTGGNNFDKYTLSASLFRNLNDGVTKAMVGTDYVDHEFDGGRGGYDSVTLLGGADHVFNPYVNGFGRVGMSFSTVDNINGTDDSTTPYLSTGLDYNPTEKTSLNGSVNYSLSEAQNSLYNAQEQLQMRIGVRHDLTAKISIASALSYVKGWYDGSFAIQGTSINVDAEDSFVQWNVRGSYQVNRNNFVEVGYEFTDRSVDSNGMLTEYDRNRVDIGWRLRL